MKKRSDGRYRVKKTIDGKVRYFYADTRLEALQKAEDALVSRYHPRTFEEITKMWYDDKWDSFAYGTQNCYRSSMNRALDAFGKELCDDVEPMGVQDLLENMKKQNYSQKAVKTQKTVISAIYRYAQLKGFAKTNPATLAQLPKGLTKELREPPSDADIEKVKADKSWIYPQILLYTGCRRGEALALTYEDFDFVNNTVNIDKEIVFKSNEPYLVHRTKTHAGVRKVGFVNALKTQIPKGKTGPLFDNITLRRFKTLWAHYCKNNEFEITPHQLRHAYATMLYDAGVDAKVAQKLLGHSSLKMTMDLYTHIRESRIGCATDLLNNFIDT